MADTRQDLDINKAIDRLESQRELRPCDGFNNASRLWLKDWCLCGWHLDDHGAAE